MGDLRGRKKNTGLSCQSAKYNFEDHQTMRGVKQGALLGTESLCISLLMSSSFNFAKFKVSYISKRS